jgi:hypothetical protein
MAGRFQMAGSLARIVDDQRKLMILEWMAVLPLAEWMESIHGAGVSDEGPDIFDIVDRDLCGAGSFSGGLCC